MADSVPRMSRSDELVIWMSSTAMKAPSMPAAIAIQVRMSTAAPLAGAPGIAPIDGPAAAGFERLLMIGS